MTSDPINCQRCGKPHPRCSGHNQQGDPCMRWPKKPAKVCPRHGGHAPQVIAAAERRRVQESAAAAVATYGLPVNISPAQALLEEVHRTAGHIAYLGSIIASSEPDDLVWGVSEETDRPPGAEDSPGGIETKRRAAPSVWLDLYQKERAHLARVCRDALGADAAGRVASVLEQIGGSYLAMFVRVLDRSALPTDQRQVIQGFLVEELQALVEGGEPSA